MIKLNKQYASENEKSNVLNLPDPKVANTLQMAATRLLFFLFLFTGFTSANAGVIVPAPVAQSIDCSWSGNYVNCTIHEPQGIGNVLIFTQLDGSPWWQVLDKSDCPTTASFGVHADGPTSLMIDVNPCGGSSEAQTYSYLPMDTGSHSGNLKVLKIPGNSPAQTLKGLVEESKRLRNFMQHEKNLRGIGDTGRIGSYATFDTLDEYKCKHDPPVQGDTCSCGGHAGPGSEVLNIMDCAFLQIDCAEGSYDKIAGTCSNWDGDPIPGRP